MKRSSRCSAFLALVLSISLCAVASAQTGEIHGVVSDSTPAPRGGLTVQLEDEWGGYLDSTTTLGSGAYQFTSLADGVYLVRVLSDVGLDLVGEYYDDVSEWDHDLATRLSISGGNTLTGVDFELAVAGSISGAVSGLAPGESVALQLHDGLTGRYRGQVGSDPVSFLYSVGSVAPGSYTVMAWTGGTDRAIQWYDGRHRQSLADDVTVAENQDVTGIDLALGAGGTIAGSVALIPDPGDGGATVSQTGVAFWDAATGEGITSTGVAASGDYSFPNLPAGSYAVEAQPHGTGYAPQVWVSSGGPVYRWEEGEPVSVTAGGTASGIDFTLELGREISGRVHLDSVTEDGVQEPGEPGVEGASVQAHPWSTNYWGGTGTDAAGDYTMSGLPPGRYWISVESGSLAEPFVAEQWDDLPWGSWDPSNTVDVTTVDQAGIDFGVVQDKVISGQVFRDLDDDQVLDPGEAGLQNVTVRVFDHADGRHLGHAVVDSDGQYSVGVAAGVYRVEADPHVPTLLRESWLDAFFAEDATPVDVTSADASGIDIGLVASSTYGTLRGRLVTAGAGTPVAGVRVQVHRWQSGEWMNASGQTDANGDFLISNLPPGSYQVWFDTQQSNAAQDTDLVASYWSSSGAPGDTDPANLRIDYPAVAGDGTDLGSFGLIVGGSISGTAYPPAGDSLPLPTDVQLESPEGSPQPLPGARVRADGTYHVRGVPAGSLRVQAAAWDPDFVRMYYQSAGASTFDAGTATEVAVSQGLETGGIDLHLERGGSVTGTITRWDGTPLANFPIWADLRNDPQGRSYWPGHQSTDANGLYRFRGLPAGDYWVQTDGYGTDLVNEAYPTLVTVVAPSETSGIDFVLDLGGSISGSVRDEVTTDAIAGVCIYAREWASNQDVANQCTDANGFYRLRGLAEGSYRLYANPWPQDYLDEHYDDARDWNLATPVEVPATPVGGPVPEVANIDFDLAPGVSVSGTVTELDGVTPIEGLAVSAHGRWGQGATTAADGTYQITRLEADVYTVAAETSGTGYARQTQQVDLSGGSVTGVDFALGPGASISGKVVNESAVPLADVQVSAHRMDTGEWVADDRTDAAGDYEISGLAAGTYQVQTEPDDRNYVRTYYNNRLWGSDPVTISESGGEPQSVSGIDFTLVQGYEIRGLVFHDLDDDGVQDAGEPSVNNAWVNTQSEDGSVHNWTGTHNDGTYTLYGTYPGRHTVHSGPHQGTLVPEFWQNVYSRDAATLVDVTAGDAAGIDFSLVDGSTIGILRGQVTDSVGGIPGVDVQARLFDTDEHVASATSDANGNFTFYNLAPGSYKIWFETWQTNVDNDTDFISSFWASTGEPGVIDPNLLRVDYPEVPGDGTDLGAFSLLEGGSISGQVVPQGGATLPPGLQVQAESFESGGGGVGASVDASGNYRLRGLPAPATYRVYTAHWTSGDLVGVYYLNATESTFDHNTASAVEVEIGLEISGIDLFPWEGGSISGRVTRAADGSPVVNAGVNSDLIDDPLGRSYWQGGGQTDANGDYVIRGLPSGDYQVRAYPNDPGLANQNYANPVAVAAPNDTAGVDFALEAAGLIRGRVTQLVGGQPQPVANMPVQADDYDTGEYGNESNTDVDGYYTIGSLSRGQAYRVHVKPHQGHDPQFFNFIIEYWDGHWAHYQADPVVVPTGEPAEAVADFELELGGAISGLVTGGGGPLQNVGVCAWDFASGSFGNCDSTDHNGFYIIRGLPPGSYGVDANPWPQDFVYELYDDTTDHSNATPVTVLPVPEGGPIPITDAINFDLDPAYRISGKVTEADGITPIPNLNVSAHGIDVSGGSGVNTRSDGTYELRGLAAGRFRVEVSTDGTDWIRQEQEVDLTSGDVTGVDFALQLGAAISGRVYFDGDGDGSYDPGEEEAGLWVDAYDFDTEDGFGSVQTDADGVYRLPGLGAGRYRIEVRSDERNYLHMYWDHALRWDQASPVVVFEVGGVPQDVGGIDFRLVEGGEIRGTVFYDANGDGIRQEPDEPTVGNLNVSADDWGDAVWAGGAWGNVEPDGTYALHGLHLEGQYLVRVEAQGTPYASEYYKLEGVATVGTSFWSEADAVDVSSGEATGIDFSLDLGGGIRGVVRDRLSGEPLSNVDVYTDLFDEGGMWNGTTTDNNGGYSMTGLPAGDYRLEAWDNDSVYVGQHYDDALFWEDASPVQVDARTSPTDDLATVIDFYLDQGGVLEGRIYDAASGIGIPNAEIYAEEHGGDHRYFSDAVTQADGTYRLGALPPGVDLRIWASGNTGHYFDVFYDGGGDDLGSPFEEDAEPVVVTGGQTIQGFDFALQQGGVIEGQVTDQGTGAPLGGVNVQFEEYDEPHRFWNSAQTEADGTYTLGGLVPGVDVRVWADHYPDYVHRYWTSTGGSLDWGEAERISAGAGETIQGIDFALERAGAISGTVTDGDGAPLADLRVCTSSYDGGPGGGCGNTDPNGLFTIGGLPADDYRVDTGGGEYPYELYDNQTDWNAADRVSVTSGATTAGIDFVLPRAPEIVSGPTPAAGERGSTVTGIAVTANNLYGGLCVDPVTPPCVALAFGGTGLSVVNTSLDEPSGTITFDLTIAADATLGLVSMTLVNEQALEDGVAFAANAFEVQPAATGDVPATSSERLYVPDGLSSTVRVYGAADHSLLGTIETIDPSSAQAAADGSLLFLSGGDRKLAVIDTRLGEVGEEIARLPLYGAWDRRSLALAPDALYATDRELGNYLRVIDRASWQVLDAESVLLAAAPFGARLDPTQTRLWVFERFPNTLELVDVDPASPDYRHSLGSVPMPDNARPDDLAFTPDGTLAYIATNRGIYAADTATVLTDPGAIVQVWGQNSNLIEILDHAPSGKLLGLIRGGEGVAVLDLTAGPGAVAMLRTIPAGSSPSFSAFGASTDKLYIANGDVYELYAVDLATLLSGPAPSVVRFDAREAGRGLLWAATTLVAPTPAAPPATAPVVTVSSGSPATNNALITVQLSGSNFAADTVVRLQGVLGEGDVTSASPTNLTVELPLTTPTGAHTLVVTNPNAGAAESGLSDTQLEVQPPAAYEPSQTLYATGYSRAEVSVLNPDGSVDTIYPQPAPAHMVISPDGKLGFIGQYDVSEWRSWNSKPVSFYDVSIVDLDPASPTYLEVLGVAPWIFQAFTPLAVTPDPESPNGVFAYAANRYMSDTVSVIDPVTLGELDIDGDPATESIPWQHPYWWWLTWMELPNTLAGISRIELDGDVLDRSLQPTDLGLTPDGNLLYVANRSGSVSIVDAVTRQVVGQLDHGGNLSLAVYLEVAPVEIQNAVYVYVVGNDTTGQATLFIFEAGLLDDVSASVDRIPLPIQDEFPREMTVSPDGKRVYLTIRQKGVLLAMDVWPANRGEYDTVCITAAAGAVSARNANCADSSQPIPGLLHAVEAAADGLLYVNNSFGEQIWALDRATYGLVTSLGSDSTWLAVQPPATVVRPVITAVSPSSGSPDGGDPVVLTGANFQLGATVTFGTEPATGVVVDSAYTIHAVSPASSPPGTTGPVEVKVENPDGRTGKRQNGFTYQIDATPPVFTTPPYVAGQALVGPAGSETVTAEIRWATDEAASSALDYRRVGDPSFTQQTDAALVTDHVMTLTGLDPATDYEYRATSADAQGNSASSPVAPATLTFTTLSAPDTTAPVILSGPTASVTTDSATIVWQTNEVASSAVIWDDVVDGGGLGETATGAQGTDHTVGLAGLTSATDHEYRALSTDLSGNGPTQSPLATFTTATLPDTTAPVITLGPELQYLANDLVIVYWETDELSTSFVNYGRESIAENGVVDVDLVTAHVVFLTNLLPNTTYYYQVGSTDPSGNTVLSIDPFESLGPLTAGTGTLSADLRLGVVTLRGGTTLAAQQPLGGFTTPEAPDTEPPLIGTVSVTTTDTQARIEVEVDEPASLRARYGVAGLTDSAFAPAFQSAPSLLLAGLAPETTYQLTLELTDPKGNVATVSPPSFTTQAAPDLTAPAISGLAVDSVSATAVRVVWQTDEAASASVRFAPAGDAYTRQAGALGQRTSHAVWLSNLTASTDYAFEAASSDSSGNRGSATGSFTTLAPRPTLTSVLPARAAQGATIQVVLNGSNFGTAPVVDFGTGVTVQGSTVNTVGSQIQATIAVAGTAALGGRTVSVATNGYTVTAPFAVVDETVPVVTITSPTEGDQLEATTVPVSGEVSEAATVTVNGVPAATSAPAAEGSPYTFQATIELPGTGPQRIVAAATDASGNRGTAVVNVTVVNQPPVAVCANVVVPVGPDCTAEASVDDGSYDPDGDPLTVTQDPAGPFGPGIHQVTLTVEDDKGATATCYANVTAALDFDGFLPPIGGADDTGGAFGNPLQTFKLQSTIPIKFRVSCSGTPYVEGTHTLHTVMWTSETDSGEPIDATPQDAATTGNAFRLTGEEWHFNLDALGTGMSQGQWQLIAALADGTEHWVWIQIK